MVKINELRTGNILLFDNRVVDVLCIHKSGRIFVNPDGYIHEMDLSPVFLNRDWLLDYGFKETARGFYKHRHLTEIFATLNDFFFRYDGKIIATCKYVHELQNIFFAIYKEEIKIKVSAIFNLNQSTIIEGESFSIEKKPEVQIQ